MYKIFIGFLAFIYISLSFANDLPIDQLQLPPNFSISVYADNVEYAREIAIGKNNVVFVGSNYAGKVYALIPNENHTKAEKVITVASGLNQPMGVAYYKGDLYVAEVDRIIRYKDIDKSFDNFSAPEVIYRSFPLAKADKEIQSQRHGWKYIRFSPDGWLYVAVGIPCDVCMPDNPMFGTIMRMKSDGSQAEIYAKGIRNSVGFDWHPVTKEFWFTENGSDKLGDYQPPDILDYAPVAGLDFGFPYYHGLDDQGKPFADPKFGKLRSPEGITWPAFQVPAHVAVLGMSFYKGNMFPKEYKNQIFIAEHGSWVPKKKVGYKISLINFNNGKPVSYKSFITGWEVNEKYWGRPVDVKVMDDGSLLISDDEAGAVYRVTYR